MSIGIYMPAHNVGKYIGEAIKSIEKQTYKDWELVIIDDASDDDTYDKVKPSNRIKVFRREERCGLIGRLKNECIAQLDSSHDFICHVGSDDLIPEDCFKTFVKKFNNNPDVGMLCGNFVCFDNSGKQWVFPHVANSSKFKREVLLHYMCAFPMRMYRKSIVEKVGGYSNELLAAVDYDISLKIDEITRIERIINPVSYFYRQHSEQVSSRARPEQDACAKIALENALLRRNINAKVVGNAPPFKLESVVSSNNIQLNLLDNNTSGHFIWGKK